VERHFERAAQRDLEGAAALYHPNIRVYGLAPEPLDREGWKQGMAGFLTAFPDGHFVVDEVISEGDRVAVRYRFEGTHQDTFQGIPATGKAISLPGIVMYRAEGGQLVEAWTNADFLGLLQQLGAIPAA
jgi:steroid delta-isomerase-like uncharacterized protein